jgi:transcriptional regulatory protein RtcR
LAERGEDIEPNIDYVLQQYSSESGQVARFNKEARARYLAYATSTEAAWTGNFRDLSASVTRLATLADGGRITDAIVNAEIFRLKQHWQMRTPHGDDGAQLLPQLIDEATLAGTDLYDKLQLQAVVNVCRQSRSLSDAGRQLFAVSTANRAVRGSANDADRLRKYLAKYQLTWAMIANLE